MGERDDNNRRVGRKHIAEARRLIAVSAVSTDDAGVIADAVQSICSRITDHLEPLISLRAAQALLARAVHLSKPKFKMLDEISTAEAHVGDVARALALRVRTGEPRQTLAAVESVLGNFIWLLTRFMGDDFTLRLLREACPIVTRDNND
jgi:hypothetical protein